MIIVSNDSHNTYFYAPLISARI